MDCFVVRDGKARWSPDEEGYAVYASRAESLGLTAGRYFTSIPDNPHVQLRSSGSPRDLYFDIEIEARMVEIFGKGQWETIDSVWGHVGPIEQADLLPYMQGALEAYDKMIAKRTLKAAKKLARRATYAGPQPDEGDSHA
jgi:hypothetical protein